MEQLTTLEAGFLEAEDADRHVSLVIGTPAVIDGPLPEQAALTATLSERIRGVSRFRQRVRKHPFEIAAPEWVEDTAFDITHHLRWAALPQPGDDAVLFRTIADLMERRLDRDHPLWECWVIESLPDGRWGALMKIHHWRRRRDRRDADAGRCLRCGRGCDLRHRHPRRHRASAVDSPLGGARPQSADLGRRPVARVDGHDRRRHPDRPGRGAIRHRRAHPGGGVPAARLAGGHAPVQRGTRVTQGRRNGVPHVRGDPQRRGARGDHRQLSRHAVAPRRDTEAQLAAHPGPGLGAPAGCDEPRRHPGVRDAGLAAGRAAGPAQALATGARPDGPAQSRRRAPGGEHLCGIDRLRALRRQRVDGSVADPAAAAQHRHAGDQCAGSAPAAAGHGSPGGAAAAGSADRDAAAYRHRHAQLRRRTGVRHHRRLRRRDLSHKPAGSRQGHRPARVAN